MDFKCALRQTIIYQCPSWAWDNVIISGSGQSPDLKHRISLIPAEPDAVLHIRENVDHDKEIRVNNILVTVLKAGSDLRIDAEARYLSEMTGKHAKYSQHICDAELNIESSTSMSDSDIKIQAHDILRANLISLRDMMIDQGCSERLKITNETSIAANLWHCHTESFFVRNDLIIQDVHSAMETLQKLIR